MKLRYERGALADLDEIFAYIAADSREAAGRLVAALTAAVALESNDGLSSRGMMLFGSGFIVTRKEAVHLGLGKRPEIENHVLEYRNGRDLSATPRGLLAIDLFGLSAEKVRQAFPEIYQHLLVNVKPERDVNRDVDIRERWWLFGRTRDEIRPALYSLPRYIATVETAKHLCFSFSMQ